MTVNHLTPALAIRRLTEADTADFRAVLREALVLHPAAFWSSPEEEDALSDAEAAARMRETYVAGGFRDGALDGFALYLLRPYAKLRHKGQLALLYVRATARGSGLADALIRHVIEGPAAGLDELLLNVSACNARALRFYRRWGFVAYGREADCVRLPTGESVDELFLAKSLR